LEIGIGGEVGRGRDVGGAAVGMAAVGTGVG